MKAERIPLFPLNLVLFPGASLPLHIFEPRYKEMIARSLEEKLVFTIVFAPSGGIASVGCTADITQILRKYPDGRLDILTAGVDVVRVIRVLDEKPYLEAVVQYLDDVPYVEDAASAEKSDAPPRSELLDLFQKCHQKAFGKISAIAADFPDASLTYRLAAELPVDLARKQELLEIREEPLRRKVLLKILAEWLPRFESVERARGKAAGNGHSKL